MITIILTSNQSGQRFRIDTRDSEQAKAWLYDTVLWLRETASVVPCATIEEATDSRDA